MVAAEVPSPPAACLLPPKRPAPTDGRPEAPPRWQLCAEVRSTQSVPHTTHRSSPQASPLLLILCLKCLHTRRTFPMKQSASSQLRLVPEALDDDQSIPMETPPHPLLARAHERWFPTALPFITPVTESRWGMNAVSTHETTGCRRYRTALR